MVKQLNMGVLKPAFPCIKAEAVDNVQRSVNKGSDTPYSIEKHDLERLLFPLVICVKMSAQTFYTAKLNF